LSRLRIPWRHRSGGLAVRAGDETSRLPVVSARKTAPVVVGFRLALSAGEFRLHLEHQAKSHRLAILGPSGAGKSLTLRALAGLLPGEVNFSGREVGGLPPEQRRVGYVPQGQSLLTDRSAWANATLGPHADPELASYWLRALGMQSLQARLPAQMSGGQRQRVALARAFSCRPEVVLMDEPFTALDSPVRAALVRELRRLQLESGLSTVLVTHDFREAALLADEVVVISEGEALQSGPVREVSSGPASPDVARMLGLRNITSGVAASPSTLKAGAVTLQSRPHGLPAGAPLAWCARPEQIALATSEQPGTYPALVVDAAELGGTHLFSLALEGGPVLEAEVSSHTLGWAASAGARPGTRLWAGIPAEAVLVWPAGNGPAPGP
jgi:ABC-type sulfate/molybdate transport systems ATPase subunit